MPSSSGCSPAWAWPVSATSPCCRPVTSWPASDRPARHAHRLATASTTVRPAAPSRRPSGASSRPSTIRSIQLDPLVFVGKHLADQLVAALAAEGRVCTRLVVTAETDHGERSERAWYRAAGMSAPAMVDRVRWQLDAWLDVGGRRPPGSCCCG